MADAAPPLVERLKAVGARYRFERLPGATHFYPKTTPTSGGADVETTMASFLKEALRLG